MGRPLLWLGGWASGLECWRAPLAALYPGREHAFLDAHAALAEPGLLERTAAALPPQGTLVAWSLGALLLHRAALGDLEVECGLVSASPVFDFCRAGGPWPEPVVARMERRLGAAREEVLRDFWALTADGSAPTPEREQAWIRQARGYSEGALREGLQALRGLRVDPAELAARRQPIRFLASAADPLSPWPEAPAPLAASWSAYPRGHLPFLEYPDLLEALL